MKTRSDVKICFFYFEIKLIFLQDLKQYEVDIVIDIDMDEFSDHFIDNKPHNDTNNKAVSSIYSAKPKLIGAAKRKTKHDNQSDSKRLKSNQTMQNGLMSRVRAQMLVAQMMFARSTGCTPMVYMLRDYINTIMNTSK